VPNEYIMTTTEFVGLEAEARAASERGWNWGLIIAFGLCVAFWAAVILGIVVLL
jgi:hypothetical protein